jgi:hypothetical protein
MWSHTNSTMLPEMAVTPADSSRAYMHDALPRACLGNWFLYNMQIMGRVGEHRNVLLFVALGWSRKDLEGSRGEHESGVVQFWRKAKRGHCVVVGAR